MVKSLKDKYLENIALAQIWIMNVTLVSIELMMVDVWLTISNQQREIHMA